MSKSFEQFKAEFEALVEEGQDLDYIHYGADGDIIFEHPREKAERKERERVYREQLQAQREAEFIKLWEIAPNESKEETK